VPRRLARLSPPTAPGEKTMNGWTNYETWLSSLWIQNDEGFYNEARRYARRGKLQEFITEFLIGSASHGFAIDMMSAAIERLDWKELQGIFEEEEEETEEEEE
jgi:hypothetical protein